MQLKDKVIILTGAARVGKAVARALGSRGAHLAITYLSHKVESEFVCEECSAIGSKSIAVKADLSKKEDIENLIKESKKEFGRIDGLVHMAAIYPRTPWDKLTEADWDKNMNIIAKSAFLLGKMVGDELLKNKGEEIMHDGQNVGMIKGKMVFFSDWSVLSRPYKDYLPYNAAKTAVVGLTKSFAKELAPDILVNAIAPGPILRPADLSEEENKEVMKNTPLQRWGGEEEIAKAVLYLMDSDFITGQVLFVDGGRSIG